MRSLLRRRTLSLLAAATAALVPAVGSAAPAGAVPPTPGGLPSTIEGLAGYVGADSCDGRAKPGTVALGQLLTAAYPGTTFGTVRACGSDSLSTSEHYDGRAVDWMGPNARNAAQKKKGDDVVAWLLAADQAGNQFANARRLGVMYLIWNNQSWSAYATGNGRNGWEPYSTCASHPEASWDTTCHRNHVHLSLSWEGAMKRTSWWTNTVAAPDFGPCRTPELNWASPYRSRQASPCDRYARVSAPSGASALTRQLVGFSGMYVYSGSTGPVVSAVQQAIGLQADGAFGSGTRSALVRWQANNCVPASGVTDAATWRALIGAPRPSTPGPLVAGFDGDGHPDLLARSASGEVTLHPGNGSGGFAGTRTIGTGWGGYTALFSPGDFTGDGRADLIARIPSGGLCLWRGNGSGGWAAGGAQLIGTGWGGFTSLFSPGDFTGDGKPDVLARGSEGTLKLFAGNGAGRFSGGGTVIGAGWDVFTDLFSPGDFTGDGKADLVARSRGGLLYLYAGNGAGGFSGGGKVIGRDWNAFAAVLSAGDFDGDDHADLITRSRTGTLKLYSGNGAGGFSGSRVIGTGWTDPMLLGVR